MHPSVSNTPCPLHTRVRTPLTYTTRHLTDCSKGLPRIILVSSSLCALTLWHVNAQRPLRWSYATEFISRSLKITLTIHIMNQFIKRIATLWELLFSLDLLKRTTPSLMASVVFHLLQDCLESLDQLLKILFTDQKQFPFLFVSSSVLQTSLRKMLPLFLKSRAEGLFTLSKDSCYTGGILHK